MLNESCMIIYKQNREEAFIETITGEYSNSLPVLRIFTNVWYNENGKFISRNCTHLNPITNVIQIPLME